MRGFLGLGSNLGDRLHNLRRARDELTTGDPTVVASSSIYETEPQGEIKDQPDFLNACVEVETGLDPEGLLARCKAVEQELGRGPSPRHGPRVIDVDVLLLGSIEHRSATLTLPHRDVLRRRFVLAPLLELDPDLRLPDGTLLVSALASTAGQRVQCLGPW